MVSASSRLMSRVAKLGSVVTGGRAAGHWTRAIWVEMRLCARWKVTDLLRHKHSLLRPLLAKKKPTVDRLTIYSYSCNTPVILCSTTTTQPPSPDPCRALSPNSAKHVSYICV